MYLDEAKILKFDDWDHKSNKIVLQNLSKKAKTCLTEDNVSRTGNNAFSLNCSAQYENHSMNNF